MTNYRWDDLLCEVARKVGWGHWLPNPKKSTYPPLVPCDEDGFILSPDDLNALGTLSERAETKQIDLTAKTNGFEWYAEIKLDMFSGFQRAVTGADTLAHAWLTALACAVVIEVEKFEEANHD